MVAPTGIRRVKPAASKTRVAASKEVAKRVTTKSFEAKPAPRGPDEVMEEILSDREFPEGHPPAFVRMSAGNTYNLQNFEFLRIDVAVTLPCHPSEVRETMEVAAELVSERLMQEEITWGIGSGGK